MQQIAVANHKGGVGKTTLTACLAGALIERGKRVLVVDLDQQGSASDWLGNKREAAGEELRHAIVGATGLMPLVQETPSGVDLIATTQHFHSFEVQARSQEAPEFLLRDAIATLEPRWDYLLYDCPPSLQLLTASALFTTDFMLVPVEVKYLSLRPLTQLFDLFQRVQHRFNPRLCLAGIVAGKVKGGARHCIEIVDRLRQSFGDAVFQTVIRDSIRLGEAPGHMEGITRYDPKGYGASDFRALAEEFETRIAKLLRARDRRLSSEAALKRVANG